MKSLASFVLASSLVAGAASAGPPALASATPATQRAVPAIPEPAALALFVLGAGVVGVAIRRRQS